MTKKFSELKIGEEFMLKGCRYVKIREPASDECSITEQPTNAICIDNGYHTKFSSECEIPHTVFADELINNYNKIKFTDAEYRILLAALRRERRVCEEVNEIDGSVDLIKVCDSIEKKIHNIQYR